MAKKKDDSGDLLAAGAIAAGVAGSAYLIYKLLTSGGKKTTIFRCADCGTVVKKHQSRCGRCGRQLMWGGGNW